jgi:hypothetical protein
MGQHLVEPGTEDLDHVGYLTGHGVRLPVTRWPAAIGGVVFATHVAACSNRSTMRVTAPLVRPVRSPISPAGTGPALAGC